MFAPYFEADLILKYSTEYKYYFQYCETVEIPQTFKNFEKWNHSFCLFHKKKNDDKLNMLILNRFCNSWFVASILHTIFFKLTGISVQKNNEKSFCDESVKHVTRWKWINITCNLLTENDIFHFCFRQSYEEIKY